MISRLILFFFCLIFAHLGISQKLIIDSFTDDRDQQVYSTIQLLDGKTWMSENLNFKTENSWCYDNDSSHCEKLGRLYTWDAVKNACPKGWHLPSDEEWYSMLNKYGKISSQLIRDDKFSKIDYDLHEGKAAYEALIENGSSGFENKFVGTYIIFHEGNEFKGLGKLSSFWANSAHPTRKSKIIYYSFSFNYKTIRRGYSDKKVGKPCRCIKDE